MAKILQGVRVLDFGRYIAGPFCATLLGDLGAEVIRVEKLAGGEDRFTVPLNETGAGAYFAQIGRGKQSLTLDPKAPEAKEITTRLVETADIVVVNLPRLLMEKMGLTYEQLQAIKPDIILVSSTAYGTAGPYAERGGFDTMAQAISGNMYLSGSWEAPGKSFAPYCDFGTAAFSAFGALAALLHKQKTGQGQHVETSLLSTALTFNNAAIMEQAICDTNRMGSGPRGQYNAPTDAFRALDGWIMVQVVGQSIFERWADLIGAEDLKTDPNCQSDQARGDFGVEISYQMASWVKTRTCEQALHALAEAGVPAAQILSPEQVLQDEHVLESGLMRFEHHINGLVSLPIADHPVRYSESQPPAFAPAPALSADTDTILIELGYSPEDIRALKQRKVV